MRCLGCDSIYGIFKVRPAGTFHFNIAGKKCTTILDVRIEDGRTDLLCWFNESKRLKPKKYESEIKAQKVAETLAFANEVKSVAQGKDIEVFCIGVRHVFVTFAHTLIPNNYLNYIERRGLQSFDDPDSSIVHKLHEKKSEKFPSIPNGYNITNPIDRKFIIESIWSTLSYIAAYGIFREPENRLNIIDKVE